MSSKLIEFLSKLEKKDLFQLIKSVAKFPKAEELIRELKNRGMEVDSEITEELCDQLNFPIEEGSLKEIFGGWMSDTGEMDELDWEYFSQHPEYGVIVDKKPGK